MIFLLFLQRQLLSDPLPQNRKGKRRSIEKLSTSYHRKNASNNKKLNCIRHILFCIIHVNQVSITAAENFNSSFTVIPVQSERRSAAASPPRPFGPEPKIWSVFSGYFRFLPGFAVSSRFFQFFSPVSGYFRPFPNGFKLDIQLISLFFCSLQPGRLHP